MNDVNQHDDGNITRMESNKKVKPVKKKFDISAQLEKALNFNRLSDDDEAVYDVDEKIDEPEKLPPVPTYASKYDVFGELI